MKRFLTKSANGSPPKKRPAATPWATPAPAAAAPAASSSSSTAGAPRPLMKFISWNCNSLLQRLKGGGSDWAGFKALVAQEQPDIIALQEVRMPCARGGAANRRTRMHSGDTGAERAEHELVKSDVFGWATAAGYRLVLSLADTKKAGQLVGVRQDISGSVRSVSFNLLPGDEHEAEGRVILVGFDQYDVLATYVPNHGYGDASFERRRRWDARMVAFLQARDRPLVWLGDLNVCLLESDVSHPDFFAKQRGKDTPLPSDPAHRGQPGYTPIERQRFAGLLAKGGLLDAYRTVHPEDHDCWTWRGSGPAHARYYAKGMRIDYTVVSAALLQPPHNLRIARAAILGTDPERHGFFGSDHCPILLELERVGPPPPAVNGAPATAAATVGEGAAAAVGEGTGALQPGAEDERDGDKKGGAVGAVDGSGGGEAGDGAEQGQGEQVVDLTAYD